MSKQVPLVVPNVAKQKLSRDEMVLCMNVRQSRTADIAAIAKEAGFDAMYIDMEHSTMPLDIVSQISLAALNVGITPLVRVPDHNAALIGRVMDGGAMGIVAPHVDNAAEAKAIVDATKFPPIGRRSYSTVYAQTNFRAVPFEVAGRELNKETLVAVMLETPAAIKNADAIAAVKGVDVLVIGVVDLCAQMGIAGKLSHPKVEAVFKTVLKACRKHGKSAGMGGLKDSPELASKYLNMGVRYMHAKNELALFLQAARPYTAAMHKLLTR